METRGVRRKVVKKAAKLLASAIRHGRDEVARILRYLDKDAAKYFKKYSGDIADELDRIAKIPDLTTRIIKEKLYNFLRIELGLSGGTSLQIADAVKTVLELLFL